MYQNTPENPMVSVGRLCHKHSRDESVLLGEYTHTGSKVRKRSPPPLWCVIVTVCRW